MKKVLVGLASLASLTLSGCAIAPSPVAGWLYTDVHAAYQATSNAGGSKVGESTCESILGWIGTGDCSIEAAKRDGRINRVTSIDYHTKSILGVYATHTLIVKGN